VSERRVKIGMIGAGFIGQLAHLMNYVEVKECQVVALAEYRPLLRARVAARYDIPRTYANHHQLLEDPEVEAVVVVTPRQYTAPVTLDCLRAGKSVISEKPMAATVQQAQQLVEEAARQKVHYVVGHMKRHDEGVQLARKIITELMNTGELGTVLFARAHCYMGDSYCKADGHVVTDEKPAYPDRGWPIAPDDFPETMNGRYATYLNTFSHNTNLLRYLFARTPDVDYVSFEQPAGGLAVLDFGEFRASLETGSFSNRGWDEHLEVYFAHGRLTLSTPPPLLKNVPAKVELYRAGSVQEVLQPQGEWTWAFRRQARAFVTDILLGRDSISPGSDALEDVRLIDTMWRHQIARDMARGGERRA
jgi:predicted dehydrogenase